MGGGGVCFFCPPLGIFMSMSSGVIQALPCFRAFLLLYKNIIRYRASMVNSAGWKSRVALSRQIDVTLSADWLNLSATA